MIFPKHKCGLHLTHNEHRDYYTKIENYVTEDHADAFKDDDAKARSVATDEIWELQWYPNTPIGFMKVSAPTLDEVLAFALEVEAQESK